MVFVSCCDFVPFVFAEFDVQNITVSFWYR